MPRPAIKPAKASHEGEKANDKPKKDRRWAKVHEVKANENDPQKLIRKTIFIDIGSFKFLKNFGSVHKLRASEIIRRALLVYKHVRPSQEDLALFASTTKKMDVSSEESFRRAVGLLASEKLVEESSPAEAIFRRMTQDPHAVGIAPVALASDSDAGDER